MTGVLVPWWASVYTLFAGRHQAEHSTSRQLRYQRRYFNSLQVCLSNLDLLKLSETQNNFVTTTTTSTVLHFTVHSEALWTFYILELIFSLSRCYVWWLTSSGQSEDNNWQPTAPSVPGLSSRLAGSAGKSPARPGRDYRHQTGLERGGGGGR